MQNTMAKLALKNRLWLPVLFIHISTCRALLAAVSGILIFGHNAEFFHCRKLGDDIALTKPHQHPVHSFWQPWLSKIECLGRDRWGCSKQYWGLLTGMQQRVCPIYPSLSQNASTLPFDCTKKTPCSKFRSGHICLTTVLHLNKTYTLQ